MAEDTEIQVPDDAPAAVQTEIDLTPAPEAPATVAAVEKPAIVTADEGIEKLKRQLAEEKQAREAADQRAQRAESEKTRALTDNRDSQLQLVTTAIANVTQALDMAETQLADAYTQQDFSRVAKIQREMATNSSRLQQLETGKQQLESRAKQAPAPDRTADPVEALASQLAPRAASWLRQHPECASGRMNQKMMAGHYDALTEGYKEGSDEYFAHIETKLGYREPESEGYAYPAPEPRAVPRRSAPASAPVSRSGSGAGERPNVVRLTAMEVEMAGNMGMTAEEYARNKRDLKREGRLQ